MVIHHVNSNSSGWNTSRTKKKDHSLQHKQKYSKKCAIKE
jgi:hypothetical protein